MNARHTRHTMHDDTLSNHRCKKWPNWTNWSNNLSDNRMVHRNRTYLNSTTSRAWVRIMKTIHRTEPNIGTVLISRVSVNVFFFEAKTAFLRLWSNCLLWHHGRLLAAVCAIKNTIIECSIFCVYAATAAFMFRMITMRHQ